MPRPDWSRPPLHHHMITSFKEQYAWLSNFYPCRVILDGDVYPTLEHAYQAAKVFPGPGRTDRLHIRRSCRYPSDAKRYGKILPLRPHWNRIKFPTMVRLLESKFTENPDLKRKLLRTYPQRLVHGNRHHDTYWGVDRATGEGANMLGKALELVRDNLRSGRGTPNTVNHQILQVMRKQEREADRERLRKLNEGKVPPVPLPKLTWEQQKKTGPAVMARFACPACKGTGGGARNCGVCLGTGKAPRDPHRSALGKQGNEAKKRMKGNWREP